MDYVITLVGVKAQFNLDWTHRYRHNAGASGRVLWYPGDVILGRELGDVVVRVQQVDDDVGHGTEPLRCVDLHRQQLQSHMQRKTKWQLKQ